MLGLFKKKKSDYRFYTNPRKYQLAAMKFALKYPGVGLNMGMGTGKTKTTIDVIVNNGDGAILVVCPKSVLDVWPAEFAKHTDEPFEFYVLDGTPKQKVKTLYAAKQSHLQGNKVVVLVTYQSVWRKPISDQIKAFGFDRAVFDESHRIKSPSTRVSLFAATLYNKIPYRMALSGTMLADRLTDVYGQFKFFEQEVFGTNFEDFKNEYFEMGGFMGDEILYVKKPNKFKKMMASRVFTVATEDVMDLPPVQHIIRETVMTPKGKRIYNELRDSLISQIDEGEVTIENVLTKTMKLQRVVSGIVKITNEDGTFNEFEIDDSKAQLCADVLEDLPKREPVVIFCKFYHDMEKIKQICDQQKRRVSELSGRVNELADWRNGKTDVLIAQIQAGAEGIDLTRARYCVYYSVGHGLVEYQQSLRRTHRFGQTKKVIYYHLVVKATIDVAIRRALRDKGNVVAEVMEALKR